MSFVAVNLRTLDLVEKKEISTVDSFVNESLGIFNATFFWSSTRIRFSGVWWNPITVVVWVPFTSCWMVFTVYSHRFPMSTSNSITVSLRCLDELCRSFLVLLHAQLCCSRQKHKLLDRPSKPLSTVLIPCFRILSALSAVVPWKTLFNFCYTP